MRKLTLGLLLGTLILAITVVPAFAEHDEPVSIGPLHCPPFAPYGEPLQGAPAQGQGGGGNAGGTQAHPPAPQAGEGSHTGDANSGHGKVCAPLGDEEGPPREDPQPFHP